MTDALKIIKAIDAFWGTDENGQPICDAPIYPNTRLTGPVSIRGAIKFAIHFAEQQEVTHGR